MTRENIIHIVKELKAIGFNISKFEAKYGLGKRSVEKISKERYVSERQLNRIYSAFEAYKNDVKKIVENISK